MGINVQSSVTKQVEADYTNIVNTTVNSIIDTNSLECSQTQILEVCPGCIPTGPDPKDVILCPLEIISGGLEIDQIGNTTCNLGSNNTTNLNNDLKTKLTSATEQWIKDNYDNYQGWFAIAFNSQTADDTQISSISQELTNEITNDISNLCSAELNSYQYFKVPLCGTYINTKVVLSQKNTIISVTSCINNNIINNAITNSVIADAIQRADNYFKSRQEGPLSWLNYLIIGIVVIGVLLVIGAIIVAVKVA